MIGTQKVRALTVDPDVQGWLVPEVVQTTDWVVVPETVEAEVDGLPWRALATLRYDPSTKRMRVARIVIEEREGGDLIPPRGLREFHLDDIVADAVQQAAIRVRWVEDPDDPLATEPTGKRPSRNFAVHVARGKSKVRESVVQQRREAVAEYRRAQAEAEKREQNWPDIYAEVGRRLNLGRTTVYRYLKAAGEIGGAK